MPTRFTMTLDVLRRPSRHVTTNYAHAFVCELLERSSGADHHRQLKSFSLGPLVDHPDVPGRTALVLNWLDDAEHVEHRVGAVRRVRLGSYEGAVHEFSVKRAPYARLVTARRCRTWRWRFFSPTYFDSQGRRLLLPEPSRVFRSLALRWNAFQPRDSMTHLPDDAVRALIGDVRIDALDLRTDTLPVRVAGRLEHRAGFVGTVTFALPPGTPDETAGALSVLSTFAEYAGVGAQTTHGFGAVRTEELHGAAAR